MVLYAVLINERHSDEDIELYGDEQRAKAVAYATAEQFASDPSYIEELELTDGMREDGWVYQVRWSPEEDFARVLRREVKA